MSRSFRVTVLASRTGSSSRTIKVVDSRRIRPINRTKAHGRAFLPDANVAAPPKEVRR